MDLRGDLPGVPIKENNGFGVVNRILPTGKIFGVESSMALKQPIS